MLGMVVKQGIRNVERERLGLPDIDTEYALKAAEHRKREEERAAQVMREAMAAAIQAERDKRAAAAANPRPLCFWCSGPPATRP